MSNMWAWADKSNVFKYPSPVQIITGILKQAEEHMIDQIEESKKSFTDEQVAIAQRNIAQCWQELWDLADIPDQDAPINGHTFHDHSHPLVFLIKYMYSMESFIYVTINQIWQR